MGIYNEADRRVLKNTLNKIRARRQEDDVARKRKIHRLAMDLGKQLLKVNGNTIEHEGQKVVIDQRNNTVSFYRSHRTTIVMERPLDDERLDEVIARWLGVEKERITPIMVAFD